MDMIMVENSKSVSELLRSLSAQDFLSFGVEHIAYVRPFEEMGRKAWAIHAADGTRLSILDSRDIAINMVRQNELQPVTVH